MVSLEKRKFHTDLLSITTVHFTYILSHHPNYYYYYYYYPSSAKDLKRTSAKAPTTAGG
jgi:hypothetical protein